MLLNVSFCSTDIIDTLLHTGMCFWPVRLIFQYYEPEMAFSGKRTAPRTGRES